MSSRRWVAAVLAALLVSGAPFGLLPCGPGTAADEPDEPPPEEPPPEPPPEEPPPEPPPEEPPPEPPPDMPPPDEPPPDMPPPDEPPIEPPMEEPPIEPPPEELPPDLPPLEEPPPEEMPPEPPPDETPPDEVKKPDPPVKPPDPEPEPDPATTGPTEEELAAQAAEKAAAKEKEIAELVKQFEATMRNAKASENDKVRALTNISVHKHHLVASAVIPWIKPEIPPMIRDTSIEVLKSMPFPEVGTAAANLLASNETNLTYARAMIALMGRSKDLRQVLRLRSYMRDETKDLELNKAAAMALTDIGHPDVIYDFILMLMSYESPSYPAKKVARKKALQPLVEEGLKKVTGQLFFTGKQWNDWWKVNEKPVRKAWEEKHPKAKQ